jgi:hypothetical protein
VLKLVNRFFGKPWLDDLRPGQHLAGDDIVELLDFVTHEGCVNFVSGQLDVHLHCMDA